MPGQHRTSAFGRRRRRRDCSATEDLASEDQSTPNCAADGPTPRQEGATRKRGSEVRCGTRPALLLPASTTRVRVMPAHHKDTSPSLALPPPPQRLVSCSVWLRVCVCVCATLRRPFTYPFPRSWRSLLLLLGRDVTLVESYGNTGRHLY